MKQVQRDCSLGHYYTHFVPFARQKKVLVEMTGLHRMKAKLVLMKMELRMIYLERMVVSHNLADMVAAVVVLVVLVEAEDH